MKKEIPVFFATDDNYAPYLGVALSSLIQCANDEYLYSVFILHTGLTTDNRNRLQSLSTDNVTIRFKDVSTETAGIEIISPYAHLTVETVYRLLIPELFPSYDKVLYLDCDLIVLRDVSILFEIDLSQHVLGVAQRAITEGVVAHSKYLDISLENMFNAGILLINTKRFSELNIRQKCFDLFNGNTKYPALEQDALTITCCGNIKFFDGRWNCNCPSWLHDPPLKEYEGFCEYILSNPWIVHFASPRKPWAFPELQYSDYFWKYARHTIFYEEILFKNIQKAIDNRIGSYFRYPLPYGRIPNGSSIVIYGAGYVGKSFYNQVKATGLYKLVAWVDRSYQEFKNNQVYSPEILNESEFDYVLIAIDDKCVANGIALSLAEMGVPQEKIILRDEFS